ncbi:MAG: molybdopterin-guanine dinucleotide biosynthesis protein B [Desulfamplus sp.]|nr:molybdopterin-guanine dinucleotide biosynthesis protein B [Desulfamplus sp.]MBF0411508.1 molybdopterin-guanine dinucleotide biosynthesis protein B [Desulfamplus sp.]
MTVRENKPNIISVVGRSGSGKTTFLEKLIPHLKKKGYRMGIIKHAHCGVEMDKKGKDSWRHKNAGAAATIVISPGLISMVKDYEEPDTIENESTTIERVKDYLSDMDIIIVEGFKYAFLPKLEIFRVNAEHDTPLFLEDKNLAAFITDSDYRTTLPIFGLDDAEDVANFIEKKFILET